MYIFVYLRFCVIRLFSDSVCVSLSALLPSLFSHVIIIMFSHAYSLPVLVSSFFFAILFFLIRFFFHFLTCISLVCLYPFSIFAFFFFWLSVNSFLNLFPYIFSLLSVNLVCTSFHLVLDISSMPHLCKVRIVSSMNKMGRSPETSE